MTMKRVLTIVMSMAWLCCHCGSLRADNVCVYEVTNVCGVSATAALIITNGAAVTCPGCPLTRGAKTNWTAAQTHTLSNAVDPSRCSSSSALFTTAPGFSNFHWTVSGPGSYSTNGTGLSATFCPTNAGSGTLTFFADVFLPTIALPCTVAGAPTISVSTDFTVLEVATLIPGFGSLTNVARVINSNHTEYRYCRPPSGTISVAATPSASVAELPDCWNLNGTPKTLTTVVPVDILGTNTIVCVAGTSGKTNSLIGTTVALAQTNTVFACVGDTNTFSVTGESFAEITWEIVPPEGGGGGASFLGTNTGHEVQILAGSSNCDFYYVRPYVTGLRDCAVQTPFKVIRVDSLYVPTPPFITCTHTNDTWRFCAVEPGAETTNINVSVTLVPSVAEADLPASYSLTNTGPGVGGEGKLSRTVNLTVVGTNTITARGGSSSKSVTVIVSRAKIAQTGPLFFCVGTTNEFSLTADSSDDVSWEITPTPGHQWPRLRRFLEHRPNRLDPCRERVRRLQRACLCHRPEQLHLQPGQLQGRQAHLTDRIRRGGVVPGRRQQLLCDLPPRLRPAFPGHGHRLVLSRADVDQLPARLLEMGHRWSRHQRVEPALPHRGPDPARHQ